MSLSLASKLRYRYQLEGYDATGCTRASAARSPTRICRPTRYRFRVSTTHDGQWTEAGVWGFSVSPPFYRTRGFIVVAALGLTLLLTMAWWLRMRALRQRYALVFAERARVSREIHDTLLQSLAALGVETRGDRQPARSRRRARPATSCGACGGRWATRCATRASRSSSCAARA